MSQETLAAKADLSPVYVSLLERSQRNLTVFAAAKIASAFHISLAELTHLAEIRISLQAKPEGL